MTIMTDRGLGDLIGDLFHQLATLVRKEGELARAEMSEKMRKMIGAVVIVLIGAVLMIPALVILLEAAVSGLAASGLAVYWAALAIGGGVFILAALMAVIGINLLSRQSLLPDRTIRQLQRDVTVATMVNEHDDFQRAA